MLNDIKRLKRTKIVATLGPATDALSVLQEMLLAGVDVVRLNFSHGHLTTHQERVRAVRQCALSMGRAVGIIADLQGPKIRIACFKAHKVYLERGAAFTLDADLDPTLGDKNAVGIDYAQLPQEVKANDCLLLDDGQITLSVEKVVGSQIYCRVINGGVLSDHKGINRQGGGLSADALTEKDYQDIAAAVALGCDYIAVSFPRSAEDMQTARAALLQLGSEAGLIAKIERSDALLHLDDIILASEGVMVARGDLAVEIGEAEVPAIQKLIIQRARALNKLVITATQMMESMIHNLIPTRAEVSDVANAVLDGTDAVMLSGETAVGDHPGKVAQAMTRICLGAERQPSTLTSTHRVECIFQDPEEAIAMAAMYTANHYGIQGIIAFTETGATPLWMSRIRSGIPIYGFTASAFTERKLTLYRGVYPYYLDFHALTLEKMQGIAIDQLKNAKRLQIGDHVLVTYGRIGKKGGTNTLKILQVL